MICISCRHRKSVLFLCDQRLGVAMCDDCVTVEQRDAHDAAHGEGCETIMFQDRTGPIGDPIADAFIAGFYHGINRDEWPDMHDYVALVGIAYQNDEKIPDNIPAKFLRSQFS